MRNFSQLLATESSLLAQLLRFGLHGLTAMLARARALYPQDPGAPACEAVERDIAALLQPRRRHDPGGAITPSAGTEANAELSMATPVAATSPHEPLRAAVMTNRTWAKNLDETTLSQSADAAALWHAIQRSLLRVSASQAAQWREEILDLMQRLGAVPDASEQALAVLPFHREEALYPGLKGAIKARGLRLSTGLPPDKRIADAEAFAPLAQMVSFWLAYIPLDPAVHHALKSVYNFGVITLKDPKQRDAFEQELIYRFRRMGATGDDPAAALWAWLDLDEALHSVVYNPPVARDSWWGKLQQEVRDMVFQAADKARSASHNVQLRVLWGRYEEVRTQSDANFALPNGNAPPGHVLACLRLYAKINGESRPGRVIYRPLQ